MKLTLEQLERASFQTLSSCYLLTGDEPLLVEEAAHLIRQKTHSKGFNERRVFYVDNLFSWPRFLSEVSQQSLFSAKKIVEVRFFQGKIDSEGQKHLSLYLDKPAKEVVLMLTLPKLEAGQQNLKLLKKIDKDAVWVTIYPLTLDKAQVWLQKKAKERGLTLSHKVMHTLTQLTEGCLHAALQEIEKWSLLFDQDTKIDLDDEALIAQILPQQKFNPFQLTDFILRGDLAHSLTVLHNLQQEDSDANLVLWALVKELQILCQISADKQKGENVGALLIKHGVWKSRHALITSCLIKMSYPQFLSLLRDVSDIDRTLKGIEPGNSWRLLEQLMLKWITFLTTKK